MESIPITAARNDIYKVVDSVIQNRHPIQIVGKRGNAVLLSEEDWNAIEETLYLSSVPGLVDTILAADKEDRSTMMSAEDLEW